MFNSVRTNLVRFTFLAHVMHRKLGNKTNKKRHIQKKKKKF